MSRKLFVGAALGALLAFPGVASAGHGLKAMEAALDHEPPAFAQPLPALPLFQSGGPGASWEFVASFVTGDPHTDLDFFTQNGETYVSVGTLGVGPNGAGQTIFQLTKNGQVDPAFRSGHPSAECVSDPSQTLGLQHDVEAAPKGQAILNTSNSGANRDDTELLVDASDNPGRCHDQGIAGVVNPPQGGLELIDVTNIDDPEEIGLTSHIGESHTVNIDPRRPHIAYSVTSDEVTVNAQGQRENEIKGDNDRKDLDGFEVVDMSSCMYFPADIDTLQERRDRCRPQVYRYRYPTLKMSLGHTQQNTVYGCHELEVYPDDRLTCGSGGSLIVLDMSGAFDNNGTPRNFKDDHPRGRGGPMPCTLRNSSSAPPFFTEAMVTDCVDNANDAGKDENLDVPNWLEDGKPGELQGVSYVGTIHHMGRGGPRPATEDNDFNHEAEFSASRRLLLATDERGGGVSPPGATCTQAFDNTQGNGGVHFYRTDRLTRSGPSGPAGADAQYARTPSGGKAIYRATPRTGIEPTTCTAHVFQQIPGQNRIFMAWYSQGTQVIDFVERSNGRVELKEAGWFIPLEANEWVSHIFKVQRNPNGTYTYWGATGDFKIDAGRNAVDIYKVTMPAPPQPARSGGD
jgi:hypothetical protein